MKIIECDGYPMMKEQKFHLGDHIRIALEVRERLDRQMLTVLMAPEMSFEERLRWIDKKANPQNYGDYAGHADRVTTTDIRWLIEELKRARDLK